MQKLQRLFKKKKDKDKIEIPFFDLPLVEELIEERIAKEQFSKARNIFEGLDNHIPAFLNRMKELGYLLG